MRARLPLAVLGAAVFLSGAAALVYQVAWQRILALHSGVGALSIAVIVGAFMVGLGLGSHLGGALSLRLPPRQALFGFGLLEIGIGVFGWWSAWLYYDVLYRQYVHLYHDAMTGALLHVVALLVPTVLMGMSLPLLVKGVVLNVGTAPRTIGLLYGLNVLGASLGALVAPWGLMRFRGVRGALEVAALANLAAALLGLLVGWRTAKVPGAEAGGEEREPAAIGPHPSVASSENRSLLIWAALYAASGFCALSLELVWFRLVDVAVKSTAFTFGTVLCLYLLGSGLGSVLAAPRVQGLARPLHVFLLVQCALLAYAGTAVLLLVRLPAGTPLLRDLVGFWRAHSTGFVLPWADPGMLGLLYGFLPGALFGVPTLLMGASFPILHRAVQDDPRTSGRKVGLLQAANIAGCTLASLGLGLVGFSLLGTGGALKVLMLVGVGFALVGVKRSPRVLGSMAAVLLVLAAVLPGKDALWERLHGDPGPPSLLDEDATGVAALVPDRPGRFRVVFGGKTHSWIPFGGMHSQMGVIPAVVHPAPLDVAVIGLASGDTAWAAACREETRSLTVFELSAMQPVLLKRLVGQAKLPALQRLQSDPRVSIRVADGRNALATEDKRYDVIEADALMPTAAYSGNLYSVEFFEVCRRRLKPGGVMCTWAPTPRVAAGFRRIFPHVVAVENGQILLGSPDPIPLARGRWREQLSKGPLATYLRRGIARGALDSLRRAYRLEGAPSGEANEDLFPRDEFATPGE